MLDDTVPITNSDTSNVPPDPVQPQKQVEEEAVPALEQPQEPPPPAGDSQKSEKYLNQLINLINQDTLPVTHTDLNKFNITSIEDHYRMNLDDYEVEINHSKQPDTGQDFYIMLFNNIKQLQSGGQNCVNKVILAYTHLTESQFESFKEAADSALERRHKAEEAKRFSAAMTPIDDLLNNLGSASPTEKTAEEEAETPEDINGPKDESMNTRTEDRDVDLAEYATEPKNSDFATQTSSTT